jgi:hypothetical protein
MGSYIIIDSYGFDIVDDDDEVLLMGDEALLVDDEVK